MATKSLSAREAEIVELATQGLTNEAIAIRLGVSIGTINTYWARIKVKTGGASRTDTVAKIERIRAGEALQQADIDHAGIELLIQAGMDFLIRERESESFTMQAAMSLLHLTATQTQTTLWAVDTELRIRVLVNPQDSNGLPLAIGKTICEVLGNPEPPHPALAGHLNALEGRDSVMVLGSGPQTRILQTMPLLDCGGEVIGCIAMMISLGPPPNSLARNSK